MTYDVVFVVAAALAIVSALGVVLSSNPFYSALSLIGNLVALAAMYLLLQSDFLAAAQVIVYAGAVMIMFLFVIAYLGGRAHEPVRSRPWWQTVAALAAAIAVAAEIGFAVEEQAFGDGAHVSDLFGAPQAIGASFLGRYVLTFEATSVLLLIAAVGGVTLAARRPAPREAGAVGAFEDVERIAPATSLQAEVVDAETRFDVVRAGSAPDEEGKG
jgi:NADH-quinone oxidoreductase subunit J